MKGYWHIVALSAAFAAISVVLDKNIFIFIFIWLILLFYDKRLKKLPLLLSIFSFFFFLHHIPQIQSETPPISSPTSNQTYIGKISSAPNMNDKKIEFILEEINSGEKIMILHFPDQAESEVGSADFSQVRYGAQCEVSGVLEQPEGARNPGEFDFQNYLLSKDISYQIIASERDAIDCEGSSLMQRFFTLRFKLIEQAPNKISDYTAAWLNALVLGDDSGIDDDVIELFQNWGLSHLLAISGLHIGIVVAIVYFLLIKLNIMTKEKAEWVMLLFLPIYAVLAGAEPSVLRASMMVILLIITRRMKISMSVTDVISIVFLLLLLFDEFMIYHIGFQFSFIVTFGIILSRKWLATAASPTFQVLIISFISQIIILPLQLNYFSLLQPLSILLNLLIVPYFSIFVIPLMFLLLILSFLPASILRIFDVIFVAVHHSVIQCIEFIDRYFDYPLYLGNLPNWVFVLYYALLLLAFYLLEKNRLKQAFLSFTLLILLLTGYASAPYFSDKGYVTMLDIGQGDAFVIELPYRRGVVMIDAGASFSFEDMEPSNSVYKNIIRSYLQTRGIHQLDALFITHEDLDHMGSVEFMIENRLVKTIIVSEFYEFSEGLLKKINESNVSIQRVVAGTSVDSNNQLFTVLGPLSDKQKVNENSLVLYTELGGKRWLFTGDISKEEERELVRTYRFQTDVLKVAHHGSNTSSDKEFIEALAPEIALIPVGKNNAYGHPTMEVIERLETLSIQIFRTDQHGAVQYQYDREGGAFYKYLP